MSFKSSYISLFSPHDTLNITEYFRNAAITLRTSVQGTLRSVCCTFSVLDCYNLGDHCVIILESLLSFQQMSLSKLSESLPIILLLPSNLLLETYVSPEKKITRQVRIVFIFWVNITYSFKIINIYQSYKLEMIVEKTNEVMKAKSNNY